MEKYYQRSSGIPSWAEEDKPREKLLLKGRGVLSDAELIGILLGSGTRALSAVDLAKNLLKSVNNNLHELAKLSVTDLQKFKGIGEAKAINIVSALELGRRRKEQQPIKKSKITCSEDAYKIIRPELMDKPAEEFWVILLNRANKVIRTYAISYGGLAGTVADPKVIFKAALSYLACSLILVDNHPSGNLNPSEADIKLTKKLKNAGDFLELPVLDHIIIGEEEYFSFADENMI